MKKTSILLAIFALLFTSLASCVGLPSIFVTDTEEIDAVTDTALDGRDDAEETQTEKLEQETEPKPKPDPEPEPEPSPYATSTEGLLFSLNADKKSYTLKSIGSCRKEDIFVGSYNGLTVTSIADNALRNTRIRSLHLSDGVEKIGEEAFYYCTLLESVVLGNGVKKIGASAFGNCNALQAITIPDSVTEVGYDAFAFCYSVKSITIGSGLKKAGQRAFQYAKALERVVYNATSMSDLSSGTKLFSHSGTESEGIHVTVGANVTKIPAYLFDAYDNYNYRFGAINLLGVTFEDGCVCTEIGSNAFLGCTKLKNISVPNGVTSIGDSAFSSCSSLASFMMPDSIKTIGANVFNRCENLTSVEMKKGVETIGDSAFWGCTRLSSITIHDTVKYIGKYAFNNCTNLKKAYFEAPDGWWRQSEMYPYEVYTFDSEALADPQRAAKCLFLEFSGSEWQRG